LGEKVRYCVELFEVERLDSFRMQSRERWTPPIDRVIHLPQQVRRMLPRQHRHSLDIVALSFLAMT
jgi:hypothetical protein